MVGSFPWSYFILLWTDLNPLFSGPVENTDGIETLFVRSSTSKNYNLVVFWIIVHCTVRSLCGNVALCFDLSPFHGYRIECPHIVHVIRVSVTPEKDDILSDYATTVTPTRRGFMRRWWKCFDLSPSVFIHTVFLRKVVNFFMKFYNVTVKFI